MPKAKVPAKPLSKKATVAAMLADKPTSVAQIAEKLGISKQAAYSLISDCKRDGLVIVGSLHEGSMHYTLKAPRKPAKAARSFGARVQSLPAA
ncbi:MAG: hypothetical protein JNK47_03970 [Mesorhizobium sp.]|nr:MarR family transcriptional regulator [Mesorhizobium sp.]MBL8576359.1 hypothetical protein [Mesorhizobium sp.]